MQVDTPTTLYDRPADAFVAGFVGRANLFDAVAAGSDAVDSPLGRLAIGDHGRAHGDAMSILVRPERIVIEHARSAVPNAFDVAVERDAFHGASRRLVVRPMDANVTVEVLTAYRGPVRPRSHSAGSGARAAGHCPRRPEGDAMNAFRLPGFAASPIALAGARRTAIAQTVNDSPELYPGEKALYEQARKEGMVVSFDTGPTWANWAAQFAAFKRRYPDVEIVYNDLGSAATVVALEKARNRPQADTAYYFAASGVDAAKKGLVAPFKPVNFDKLPSVFREADGQAGSRSIRSRSRSSSTPSS